MTNDNATLERESIDIDFQVHQLLSKHRRIAIIWCIEDVKHFRPDLSDEQAWEVLEQVRDIHDAEWGISWTTLRTVADDLFPQPDDSDQPPTDGEAV
jgi:hypothetical protein